VDNFLDNGSRFQAIVEPETPPEFLAEAVSVQPICLIGVTKENRPFNGFVGALQYQKHTSFFSVMLSPESPYLSGERRRGKGEGLGHGRPKPRPERGNEV